MILHSGVIRAILLGVWTPLESGLWSGLDRTNGPAQTWYRQINGHRKVLARNQIRKNDHYGYSQWSSVCAESKWCDKTQVIDDLFSSY